MSPTPLPFPHFRVQLVPQASRRSAVTEKQISGVSGWLLHSRDPREWIRWSTKLLGLKGPDGVSLYPLAKATGAPVAVLAVLEEPLARGASLKLHRLGGEPLRLVGPVLIPGSARFSPPLTLGELHQLFPLPVELFHPRFGRVAFEAADAVALGDLVKLRQPAPAARWDRALPGTELPRSIGPARARVTEADLEPFIGGFPDDLGAKKLDDLPDQAFRNAPAQGPGWMRRRSAEWVLGFTSRAPETDGGETWVNRLENWAQNTLAQRQAGREESALEWLLRELNENPERGLRFAIPIGGEAGSHDSAERLSLGEHDIDFRLGQIGSMRGGVGFQSDPSQLWKLEAAYRRHAMKAAERGDHRRAAYIYAHLLHDLRAAAALLAEGGHYREAAALWKERLNEPREAAACLRKAGMIDEAVVLYVECEKFEEAAAMLEEVGRDSEAADLWEQAVGLAVQKLEHVRGARMLERRLHAPERASELLFTDWWHGPDGADRIEHWIALKDRLGDPAPVRRWIHGEAVACLTGSTTRCQGEDRQAAMWRALSKAAPKLQDEGLREELEDVLRVAASHALQDDTSRLRSRVLDALRRLDPKDLVWQRDLSMVRRSLPKTKEAKPSAGPKADAPTGLAQVRRFEFLTLDPDRFVWALYGSAEGIRTARLDRERGTVELVETGWGGVKQSSQVWDGVPAGTEQLLLPPTGRPVDFQPLVALDPGGLITLRLKDKSGTTVMSGSFKAGTPGFLPDELYGLHREPEGMWFASPAASGGVSLGCVRHGERDANTLWADHTLDIGDGIAYSVHLGRIGVHPVVIVDNEVVITTGPSGARCTIEMDGAIISTCSSPPRTAGRMLLVTANSVVLLHGEARQGEGEGSFSVGTVVLGRDRSPQAVFLSSGSIVVVTSESHTVFQTHQGEVRTIARRFTTSDERPAVAVLAGPNKKSYAVVDDRGFLTLYEAQ